MQDEHSARCIFTQKPAISIWAAVQLSRLSSIHGYAPLRQRLLAVHVPALREIRRGHRAGTGPGDVQYPGGSSGCTADQPRSDCVEASLVR